MGADGSDCFFQISISVCPEVPDKIVLVCLYYDTKILQMQYFIVFNKTNTPDTQHSRTA